MLITLEELCAVLLKLKYSLGVAGDMLAIKLAIAPPAPEDFTMKVLSLSMKKKHLNTGEKILKFEKVKNVYIAKGEKGYFYIRKSRGLYRAEYIGQTKAFKFPAREFIKDAKELCQGNAYWEEEKKAPKTAKFTPTKAQELPFKENPKQMDFLKEL